MRAARRDQVRALLPRSSERLDHRVRACGSPYRSTSSLLRQYNPRTQTIDALDPATLTPGERSRPSPAWASAEVAFGLAILAAGLWWNFGFTPEVLLLFALAACRWRGPGWRAMGLRRPLRPARALLMGAVAGVGYQFVGTYLIEPVIARATSGVLPDVSAFRAAIGDEQRLAILLVISWTLGALVEELAVRGWLMTRLAEIGRFSTGAWAFAAVTSSALFGVAHLYQGLSGVIASALTGLVLSVLYFATGRNLWPCIIAHGCLDTTGFVLIYLGVYPGL